MVSGWSGGILARAASWALEPSSRMVAARHMPPAIGLDAWACPVEIIRRTMFVAIKLVLVQIGAAHGGKDHGIARRTRRWQILSPEKNARLVPPCMNTARSGICDEWVVVILGRSEGRCFGAVQSDQGSVRHAVRHHAEIVLVRAAIARRFAVIFPRKSMCHAGLL